MSPFLKNSLVFRFVTALDFNGRNCLDWLAAMRGRSSSSYSKWFGGQLVSQKSLFKIRCVGSWGAKQAPKPTQGNPQNKSEVL